MKYWTSTRVLRLLVCAAAVLLVLLKSARWIGRATSPSTTTDRNRPVALASPGGTLPVSHQRPETNVPPVHPAESELTQELLSSLEAAIASDDSDKVIQLMVRIGTLIRSAKPPGGGGEAVRRWIEGSQSPRLIGILTYALSAYSGVPDDFFARIGASPNVPNNAIPALAVSQTLTQIPHDWTPEKQIAFWNQLFLCFPFFLPGVLEHHMNQHPELNQPRVGIGLGIANDLREVIQTKKIDHPASIEAVLGRVLADRQNASQLLGQLLGLVSLTNERGIALVSSALAREADPAVRNALLCWLCTIPSEAAGEALWRAYAAASVADRAQIGSCLINTYSKTGAKSFRSLWSQESDPDVQEQLLRAVGRLKTNEGLAELQRAFETGSDRVREVVREEVEAHIRLYPDSVAAKALLQQVGPSTNPRKRLKPATDLPEEPEVDDK